MLPSKRTLAYLAGEWGSRKFEDLLGEQSL
jgi:hypothetical protein